MRSRMPRRRRITSRTTGALARKVYRAGYPKYFGKNRFGQLAPQPTQWQTFRLIQLHYDLLGTSGGDQETWTVYGGVDFHRTFRGHYKLWGGNATDPQQPSDRTGDLGSAALTVSDGYSTATLQPYYEIIEVFNTSTFGCTFEIPFMFRWQKGYSVPAGQDVGTQVVALMGYSGENVMLQHTTPFSRVDMTFHGAQPTYNSLLGQFGPGVLDLSLPRLAGIVKVMRIKKWKWYIPPGGSIQFRVKQPGIKRALAANYDSDANWFYGDYALMMRMKGDLAAIAAQTNSDGRGIVRPQQYIAIRRSSVSFSNVQRLAFGRTGVMCDTFRRTDAIPSGNQQRPDLNTSIVQQQSAF